MESVANQLCPNPIPNPNPTSPPSPSPNPNPDQVANELCREAELVDDAYYVLEARRTEGEAVPLPAINVIIEACAQLEDLDRAFATWGELEAFGLAPDVHTFNALLHTCVRTREMGSGQRLLQRMEAAEIKRDAQSYFLECALA